ncbi:MAG: flagellar hook-associated protein FlgL [Planctomycetales bacterium]|nr:flagellar hook-associated protein FlgL [Planctomycetales bacterium]
MRVTSESQTQQTIRNLQLNSANLAKLQDQLASGKRLRRASDGPADTVRVLENRAENNRLATHLDTIRDASSVLESSVNALKDARDVLGHVREIAVEANNPAHDPIATEALAHEIDVSLDQMLRVANRQLPDGRHLFGGTASNVTPFEVTAADGAGRPGRVSYRGSEQGSAVLISKAETVDTLIPGSRVFQTRDRGATVFTGSTGAKAGTGTNSATGQGTLLVRHSLTTFAGTSGVAAGSSSATGDTIIGPAGAHVLTISDTSGTGATGTVSLNGGPPVTFTNTNTDLKVTGPQGEVISLNTTAITPGFSGPEPLTAAGTLSTDGGATSVVIDFSSNQIVTDGTSGAVTNVDSSRIRQAGIEQLNHSGTYDVFQLLIALRDDIRNTHGLSATDLANSLSNRLAELNHLDTGIVNAMGAQAVPAEYLGKLKDRIENIQLDLQQTTDDLESVDYSKVIVELQKQQNLYEMSLSMAARVNSLTLADFLR